MSEKQGRLRLLDNNSNRLIANIAKVVVLESVNIVDPFRTHCSTWERVRPKILAPTSSKLSKLFLWHYQHQLQKAVMIPYLGNELCEG
jgi:hypothetical protein